MLVGKEKRKEEEKKMRLMTFIEPTFHKGRSCTVRRGKFWSCLKKGEEIGLVRSLGNSKERARGIVEETRVIRYRELKGKKRRLLGEMKEIHKGKKRAFSANEIVTVVYFTVTYRAYIGSYGRLMYY